MLGLEARLARFVQQEMLRHLDRRREMLKRRNMCVRKRATQIFFAFGS
jgi:hypothetical protein